MRQVDKIIGYAKGDPGKAASISVGTVTTLQPTQNASVSNSGDSSDAVLNFGIPKGDPGKDATIKVGTVRTLQPGESATVSNSGTAENAVLDFAIPRGDDGITDLVAEYKDASEHTCAPTVAAPVVIKEIAGKTEQVVTIGYQLIDINKPDFKGAATDTVSDGGYEVKLNTAGASAASIRYPLFSLSDYEKGTVYTVAWDKGTLNSAGFNSISIGYIGENAAYIGVIETRKNFIDAGYLEFTVPDSVPSGAIRIELILFASSNNDTGARETKYYGIRAYKGSYDPNKVWEPYTRGEPAPNPDYPMPVQGVGDSGKLVIESQGKNLFDNYAFAASGKQLYTATGDGGLNVLERDNRAWSSTDLLEVRVKKNVNYIFQCDGSISVEIIGFLNGIEEFTQFSSGDISKLVFNVRNSNIIKIKLGTRSATYPVQIRNIMLSEGSTAIPYQPYHHTAVTIPLSSPLYDGDKICCVQPGESYVDADGNRAVAHRMMWGVRREDGVAVFDGSEDEGWLHISGDHQFYIYPTPEPYADTDATKKHAHSSFFAKGSIAERNAGNSNNIIYTGYENPRAFLGIQSDKWTTLANFKAYIQSHPVDVVYKLATPYFEPFPDQSPFHALRSANDLTYIYTDDPLKPEIAVDVAKQTAGAYLLSGNNKPDGIMVDTITGAECILGMENGLLTVYAIEEG